MRRIVCILTALAAGCQQQASKIAEAEMREIRAAWPGMTDACAARLRAGGIEAWPARTDECFEMTPAQRWTGLWRSGFELSRFCPVPARECARYSGGEAIWLEFRDNYPGDRRPLENELQSIEFVGRKTARPGRYGHLNGYANVIVVERLTSMKTAPETGAK